MEDKKKFELLRKERRAQRSQATKLINQIEEYKENNEYQVKLSALKIQLGMKREELRILDKEQLVNTTDQELEQEIEDAESYQFKLIEAIQKINVILDQKEQEKKKDVESYDVKIGATPLNAKLPKLQLPKFNGQVNQWRPFLQAFEATIHNRNNLTKIEKLNYLISLLQGEAAKTVEGFDLIEENYEDVLKVLKDKYGNRENLINHHLKSLMELKPAKNISNLGELKKIVSDIIIHLRTLKNIGMSIKQNSEILKVKVKELIPDELMLNYERQRKDETCDIEDIMDFIQKEIDIRERTQSSTTLNINEKIFKPKHPFYLPRTAVPRNVTWTSRRFTSRPPMPHLNWSSRPPLPQSSGTTVKQEPFSREKDKIICFRCNQQGHIRRNCHQQ